MTHQSSQNSILGIKQISLGLTKSSSDEECNMEVYKTFNNGSNPSVIKVEEQGDSFMTTSMQSTSASSSSRSRDMDGISSVIRYTSYEEYFSNSYYSPYDYVSMQALYRVFQKMFL